MRPVVKIEDREGEGQGAEGLQEEAGAGRAVQRRRVGEAGDAVWDEAQLLRLSMEGQAQAILGMEQARALGEELQRAKARIAELAAELKNHVEALQLKETLLLSKDVVIHSKDALLQAQAREMQTKDLLLQARDREISVLHADIERLNAGSAAGGAARQTAPAPPTQCEALFQEGQRLYGEQRFSEAAERWGRAALLQHAPSHAHLSDMLMDGRPGVAMDRKGAFELAAAGAALGCAHSKGVLACCFIAGFGVAADEARGLALGRESAAAGSCFGQFVVGVCYYRGWGGVAEDDAKAVRLYRLAAAQGLAAAQTCLGVMFEDGNAVKKNRAEAIRWYRLAAAQGSAHAHSELTRFGAA
jgi:TPR repeat protein